jgi:hypothetical protein
MTLAGLEKIEGATRLKTAAYRRAAQPVDAGRNDQLVATNEKANQEHAARMKLRLAS